MWNRLKTFSSRLEVRAVLFAAAFWVLAEFSDVVSFRAASFPTLWFPSGLFVAVLLFSPLSEWPAFLVASVPAALLHAILRSGPLDEALLITVSGALEAAVGAWLVRRFDRRAGEFNSPTNVLFLIVFAVLVSTALSATINTTVLATLRNGLAYWSTFRIAWIGRALGILVIAPFVLAWRNFAEDIFRGIEAERLIELAVMISGLVVCAQYIFVGNFGLNRQSYMIMPFLVWVALRFGPRGTTLSALLVTLIAAWGSVVQLDGFAVNDSVIATNMDALGSFLVVTLLTCFILTTIWDRSQRIEKALRDSETRYRQLVENQGEGVAILDVKENFIFANPAAQQIFGDDALLGRNLRRYTDAMQFAAALQQTQLRKKGEKTSFEMEIVQPSGRRRSLLITATPEYDNKSVFTGTFAVFHDITESKLSEMALRDSRSRFQTLFDHSPIPIWEVDFSRVKRLLDAYSNQGIENFREYFQENPEQVEACEKLTRVLDVNHAAVLLFDFTDKVQFMTELNRSINRGPRDLFIEELIAIAGGRTEFEMEGPNDVVNGVVRHHHVRWTVAPGYEQNYRRVIITILDVTERKQAEERMRYLSTHDVLTGLYNRNFFEAELERLQNSRIEPINVMVVDVNGMKSTNDTYGHSAGDELLRRTAQVLRMSFRKEDVIARIGGDEFVVLFTGTVPITESARRVQACLEDHNHWYDGAALSLAIGAATGGRGSSLVELFRKADQQMYGQKLHSRKHPDIKSNIKTGNSPQAN
jgi:diguanylate cyclase (GGDEF)-like protein/PAS domain S-box-containing protein